MAPSTHYVLKVTTFRTD